MGISQSAAVDPAQLGRRDVARFWRDGRFDDLECLKARFLKHVYAPHTHDTYAIGVITRGAEGFRCRGAAHVAGPGEFAVVNPDELHDGRAMGGFFTYRMFYPSVEVVRRELAGSTTRPLAPPYFPNPVVKDRELAAAFLRLHRLLERGGERLAVESAFLKWMVRFAMRHGERRASVRRVGRESLPMRRVREYIDAHAPEAIALSTLARIAGLSRYHLIRAFRRELGTTPHAYQMDRRVANAKPLLASDRSLCEVALATGFYDQSHFTRAFKARTGVTPGGYRAGSNSVQDQAAFAR